MNKFGTEEALVRSFSDYIRRTGLPARTNQALEFDAGNGIADIVLFQRTTSWKSSTKHIAIVPPRLLVLLGEGAIPEYFSIADFARLSGTANSTSSKILTQLAHTGLLKKAGDEVFQVVKKLAPPIDKIVSIEAKLNKWQHALRQAYRYREFSHQSWVLLDHSQSSAATSNLGQFAKWNVGLATINISGKVFLHHMPAVTAPSSPARFWQATSLLVRAIK